MEVVRAGGGVVPLSPAHQKILVALLENPRRVVSADWLIDDLWPEEVDLPVAKRRLQQFILELRKRLAEAAPDEDRDLVVWRAPGYLLDVKDEQIDWVRFERLATAGDAALRKGSPAVAKSYLDAALAFWRDQDPLAGVELAPSRIAFCTRLQRARRAAEVSLLEARLQLGEHRELVPDLEELVAANPLDEESVVQLAIAYHLSGRSAEALTLCREYCERLTDGHGLAPSDRLPWVESAILRQDPDLDQRRVSAHSDEWRSSAEGLRYRAFASANWPVVPAGALGPVNAELQLVLEQHGGKLDDTAGRDGEAAFEELHSALQAAIGIQRFFAAPVACIGIEIRSRSSGAELFRPPPLARAHLLSVAANPGQTLVSVPTEMDPDPLMLPDGTWLKPLGSHRVGPLGEPASVLQLVGAGLPEVADEPQWFETGPSQSLPEHASRLIGREEEIADVAARLSSARLITLTGPPGTGKTRLASEVAARLFSEHEDGSWFVSLESLGEPGLVASTVSAVVCGKRYRATSPDEALVRCLVDREAFLVLDNCEHLLSECRELADRVLTECPGVHLLATSREPLRSPFEQVLPVRPLDVPKRKGGRTALSSPAVQLFYDRLASPAGLPDKGAGAAPAAPAGPELEAVARICRLVDGMPLAIVLAAARAQQLGIVGLAEALEATLGEGVGLSVLSGEAAPEGSRDTLEGTLEWSYGALAEPQQRLFESLSVFGGRFTLDQARSICARPGALDAPRVATGLARLVATSLVEQGQASAEVVRYRLLQPIRDFAVAKLTGRADDAAAVRRRHAAYFLAAAELAEPGLHGAQERAALDELDANLADFRAAIAWATREGEAATALRLASALWVFWLVRGHISEGRHVLESALAIDPTPLPERVKALVAFSYLSWFGGDLDAARKAVGETFACAEATGDRWGLAWGLLGVAAGGMFYAEDDSVPAKAEESLELFRSCGSDWDAAQALQVLAGACWHRGQYDRAEQAFADADGLYRRLGHRTRMASLWGWGLMLALQGDLAAGAAKCEQSRDLAYREGDLAGLAQALRSLAAIARYGGYDDEARRWYAEALRIAADAGDAWSIQWALDGLASISAMGVEAMPTSVQLLACVEQWSRRTQIFLAPRERDDHDRALSRARRQMSDEAFEEAFELGQGMSLEEAVGLALGSIGARD